jgi:oligopeptide transport system substrate-binding protein
LFNKLKGVQNLKKSLSLLAIMFVVVALLVSGCGGGGEVGEGEEVVAEEMVLTYNVGTEPETMDVHLSTGLPEATIMLQIYEGLARLNSDSMPELALAES